MVEDPEDLFRSVLALVVIREGGQITIDNDDLDNTPLGFLSAHRSDGGITVAYTPTSLALPLSEMDALSLGVLAHKAGGKLTVTVSEFKKWPNGALGYRLLDEGIEWTYAREKRPIPVAN